MSDHLEKTDVSDAIDAAINAAGGTQDHLAEKLGCAQQTVSKLRSGEIPMTADWALRLSQAVAGTVPATQFYPPLAALMPAMVAHP